MEEALAVLVNVSINETSHKFILPAELPYAFDKDVKILAAKHKNLLVRLLNFCSKMSKASPFLLQLLQANNIIVHLFNSVGPSSDVIDDSLRYK